MPAIELDLATAAVVAVLLIIAAYAVAFFVYRRTTPPVSNFRRWLLTLLRGTALAIILILLFEPLVRLTTNTRQQPVLAVLVDESQSMHITDRTGDRARVLHEALS